MPLNLKVSSILAKNQVAATTPWLLLLDVTFDPANNPSDILRLANNLDDVVFNGQTYQAFAFELDIQDTKASGELPHVQLRVSNVNGLVQGELELRNGGVDSVVTIYLVNTADPGGEPELTQTYSIVTCNCDEQWATFTLGAESPLLKVFPQGTYLANYCRHTYNSPSLQASLDPRGAPCGYEGALTTCSKTLSGDNGCRAHNNVVNFGGFPGIDSSGFRRATLT